MVSNLKFTIGIDEAGRGPLAGPVVSAAVIIKKRIKGVKDSKALTPKARDVLFQQIIDNSIAFGIGLSTPEEIDKINILKATLLSMQRALASLQMNYRMKFGKEIVNALVLVDGNKTVPDITFPEKAIVKGDAKIYEISASSIIAKVTRDRVMTALSKKYPDYGFEKHKGYATESHRKAILQFGPSKIHRRTFLRKLNEREQRLFR